MTPPPPPPYATPPSCQDSEVTTEGAGGGTSTLFHSKHQFNAGPQKKRHYLLIHLFSFGVFSYDAYFHVAHSPKAPIFIPHILLWRLFSLCVISYGAYLHSAHSPTTLQKKRRHGKKITLWKIPKGRKMQIFAKNLLKHCKMTIKRNILQCLFFA